MEQELQGKIDALTAIIAKMLDTASNEMRTSAIAAASGLVSEHTHADYRRGVDAVALLLTNKSKLEFRD